MSSFDKIYLWYIDQSNKVCSRQTPEGENNPSTTYSDEGFALRVAFSEQRNVWALSTQHHEGGGNQLARMNTTEDKMELVPPANQGANAIAAYPDPFSCAYIGPDGLIYVQNNDGSNGLKSETKYRYMKIATDALGSRNGDIWAIAQTIDDDGNNDNILTVSDLGSMEEKQIDKGIMVRHISAHDGKCYFVDMDGRVGTYDKEANVEWLSPEGEDMAICVSAGKTGVYILSNTPDTDHGGNKVMKHDNGQNWTDLGFGALDIEAV